MPEQRRSGRNGFKEIEAVVKETVMRCQSAADIGVGFAAVSREGSSCCLGLGLRRRDSSTNAGPPVDPDTVFALGSVTKPLSALAIAVAADQRSLSLDEPIRSRLPDFSVMDPVATANMTLEDLVCHRTGIPRHDGLWYLTELSRDDIFDRLRHLDPNPHPLFGFRVSFQYNNHLFSAASTAIERWTSVTWESQLRHSVLEPLGMNGLSTSTRELERGANAARPYDYSSGVAVELPIKRLDNIAPAAAVNASARALLPLLQFLVNDGVAPSGDRLLSSDAFRDLYTPRISTGAGGEKYGLGWFVHTLAESTFVWHTGNSDGYSAFIGFLPDSGFAVAVLTNQHHLLTLTPGTPPPLCEVVGRRALLHLLGAPSDDPSCSLVPRQPLGVIPAHPSGGVSRGRPAAAGSRATGAYDHPAYGRIRIVHEGAALALRYFRNDCELSETPEGGYRFDIDAFGSRHPVRVLLIEQKNGSCDLALPLEPRVGWTRFQRVAQTIAE